VTQPKKALWNLPQYRQLKGLRWPQNLKNTAGHFLLMMIIAAGSTRGGTVLPRTVRLKADAIRDVTFSQCECVSACESHVLTYGKLEMERGVSRIAQ
jgi:hypothetical protein